nr:hypothetical protein [candidate division Zixibacteria bacterium]
GQFTYLCGVAVTANGAYVYVADSWNHRVQYFTSVGYFLGKWGRRGFGNGQFTYLCGVAVTGNGAYVYVADTENYRIQYFKDVTAVAPASLGRVKALFK